MEINFNGTYKNYLNYSKVYKDIKERVKADDSYLESNDEERKDYLMAIKAIMETVIMNPNCLNTREFKDRDVLYILTPNNSNEVNNYYKNKPEHKLDSSGYFIKQLISYYFSKNMIQAGKGKEVNLIESLVEEQANFRPLKSVPKLEKLISDHTVEVSIGTTQQKKMHK